MHDNIQYSQIPIFFLRFIGFLFNENENLLIYIYSIINILLLSLTLPNGWAYCKNAINDVEKLTNGLKYNLTGILATVKGIALHRKRKQIYKMVNELQKYTANVPPEDRELLKKGYLMERRLAIFNACSTLPVGTIVLISPILFNIYTHLTYGYVKRTLPIVGRFPYNETATPNYQLTYIWYAYSTFTAMLLSMGVDVLFYGCAFNCSAHFRIIQKRFQAIDSKLNNVKNADNTALTEDNFRSACKYHIKILSICNELNESYFPVLMAQFHLSSLQLCIIAYELTATRSDIILFATNIPFLAAILFQVFIYCHGGSELKTESELIKDAAYFSNWMDHPSTLRHAILFIIMRSAEPIQIKAAYFQADLATFASIISATGSYITLLQSMVDN